MTSLPQRFAVVADIHGNRWALEAVLADMRKRSIETIVDLGDDLYGPLNLHETANLLADVPAIRIQGNCDRILLEANAVDSGSTIARNRASLTSDMRQWLASGQKTVICEDILFCHGTPWKDDEYLLWKLTAQGAVMRTQDELENLLKPVNQSTIVCAHSHTPITFHLVGGRNVVNVGSVGLPAYTDELPYPHAMQAGSPHARYAIFARHKDAWEAEHIAVSYDWESAACCAEKNGRQDWARWLRRGIASWS